MSTARTAVGAATMDGLLYAAGGECAVVDSHEDTLYLRSVERYDPILKQWDACREMKVARSFIALTALGGHLYAIGTYGRFSCTGNLFKLKLPFKSKTT